MVLSWLSEEKKKKKEIDNSSTLGGRKGLQSA